MHDVIRSGMSHSFHGCFAPVRLRERIEDSSHPFSKKVGSLIHYFVVLWPITAIQCKYILCESLFVIEHYQSALIKREAFLEQLLLIGDM